MNLYGDLVKKIKMNQVPEGGFRLHFCYGFFSLFFYYLSFVMIFFFCFSIVMLLGIFYHNFQSQIGFVFDFRLVYFGMQVGFFSCAGRVGFYQVQDRFSIDFGLGSCSGVL